MTVVAILLIVLPWSIWRQMHARPVTVEGLVTLPLIFAAAAAVTTLTSTLHQVTTAEVVYNAACAVLAIGFGAWRGQRVSLWQEGETTMQRGNRATLTTWVVLIALKIATRHRCRGHGLDPGRGRGRDLRLPGPDLRDPERRRGPPHAVAVADLDRSDGLSVLEQPRAA